ncbi:hypothetical protein RHGRI_038851 [Rhododendron griersonianum]|uniref:Uncharacterized protein n=1 Tax=Rhododendron griersonianum TaxID=479676 RepID=A0AAV6HLM3_9ERIC|nr:hypothetical protein RHGRI_038851 [Rhododendron griersonianum]
MFSWDYAVLALDDAVVVGTKVYTISHPSLLKYTFSCGEVTYPDYRLKEEVDYEDDPNDSGDRCSAPSHGEGLAPDVLNGYMMMKASAAVLVMMEGGNSAMVVAAMKGGVNDDVNGDAVDGET